MGLDEWESLGIAIHCVLGDFLDSLFLAPVVTVVCCLYLFYLTGRKGVVQKVHLKISPVLAIFAACWIRGT